MKNFVLFLFFVLLMCVQSCKNLDAKNQQFSNPTANNTEWKLVWEDTFDTDGHPDPDNWDYDVADGCPHVCGWGNNELQYYTKRNLNNARVENGNLIIEAHRTKMGKKEYTSARLVTKGKQSWRNGKIEIRAKLPTGLGTWPALWMLPEDNAYGGWPRSGEIDIMEHVGYNPDTIFGTVHTEAFNHGIGTQVDAGIFDPNTEDEFHNYSIIWNDHTISWYIDGDQYHEFHNKNKTYKEWPFDKRFHLIMNIAVGGNWGGKHGVDPNIFPQKMEVDYVKVFENVAS